MSDFDNIYDPDNSADASETAPWDVIIQAAVDAKLRDVHVGLPVRVTAVASASEVSVEIQLQRRFKSGDLATFPIIENVPVMHPRGANWGIKLPIAVDDTGLLVFAERSLDAWKVSGGVVDPGDFRTHDLSDGVFYPGLYPLSDVIPGGPNAAPNNDLVVFNQNTAVAISGDDDSVLVQTDFGDSLSVSAKDGIQGATPASGGTTLSMKNGVVTITASGASAKLGQGQVAIGGKQELLDLIDQLLDGIQLLTVGTGVGPSSVPINASVFLGIKTKLGLIKGSL